jgi:hypothetical protein
MAAQGVATSIFRKKYRITVSDGERLSSISRALVRAFDVGWQTAEDREGSGNC